jgi:MFS family permease
VRRLVLLVSAIVLVDTMFYAVVTPLLPTYADELGLSKTSAGILAAAYPAGTLLGAIPAGFVAARLGAKPTVLLGLALLATSTLTFGFANDVVVLDGARFVQGLGGACSWAGGLAWLVEAAPPDRRGALIGTALGAAIGGSLLGPVVGALAEATSPEAVFSSVVVLAGGLAVAAWRTPGTGRPDAQPLQVLFDAVRSPSVLVAMWLVALPAFAFGMVGVLGALRMDGFGAGGAAVGAAFLVAAAVEGIVSPFVGRVSDRRGRLLPIRTGLAAAAVVLALVTLPQTALLLGIAIVATSAALGIFWAPAMAMLSDAAEDARLQQGLAFALVNLAWALGQVSGSGFGGALAEGTADGVPLGIAAGLCLLTLGALVARGDRLPLPARS